MNFFKNINKSDSTALLVENGLVSEQAISREEILDCVFIVADVMRETWQTMTRETAAGMVLVVLAKNARLKDYLNAAGWDLVLTLINTNPELTDDMAPGTLTEINLYQVAA
jgi:hypothetical protein